MKIMFPPCDSRENVPSREKNEQAKTFRRLQELSFALKETELYLDGHPTNRRALSFERQVRAEYEKLKKEYAEKYDPVTPDDRTGGNEWTWATSPWPWEPGFPLDPEKNDGADPTPEKDGCREGRNC